MRAAALCLSGLIVFGAACSSDEPSASLQSPTPEVSASAVATPTKGPSEDPSASASPSASPTDGSTDADASPNDTDRARFVSSYRPAGASDLEHVQVDVDLDGVDELVFSYVRGGEAVGHVDVADWNAELEAYEVVAGADGGVADRIERVRVAEFNGDGRVEVALFQATGASGASVTLWSVQVSAQGTKLVPLRARGGCWDGSATYGVTGARLDDRDGDGLVEVYATCDDSPLPVAAWSTDGYRWQDDAYVHDANL